MSLGWFERQVFPSPSFLLAEKNIVTADDSDVVLDFIKREYLSQGNISYQRLKFRLQGYMEGGRDCCDP